MQVNARRFRERSIEKADVKGNAYVWNQQRKRQR